MITPDRVAAVDQEIAALRVEMKVLALTARSLLENESREQSIADLVAFLSQDRDPVELAGLVAVAAMMLSAATSGGDPL